MNHTYMPVNYSRNWIYLSPIVFGVVPVSCIVIMDQVFSKGDLYFSKEPVYLALIFFPTTLASLLAAYLWLEKGMRFFGSWWQVAAAAWLSLLVNPAAWILVLSSLFLYGMLVLCAIMLAGAVLQVVWERSIV